MKMAGIFDSEKIHLDIGGTLFKTHISTLRSIPNSRLAGIDKSWENYDKNSNTFYFDRDADSFKHILNTYRDQELHVPRDICPERFQKELRFWRISNRLLAPCCWKHCYESQEDVEVIDVLLQRLNTPHILNNKVTNSNDILGNNTAHTAQHGRNNATTSPTKNKPAVQAPPNKLWLFLEEPKSSTSAKVWCFIYMAVVVVSVILALMWTEKSMRVDPYLNPPHNISYFTMPLRMKSRLLERLSDSALLYIHSDIHPALFAADLFCMTFFIVETVLHFVACPNKKQYPRSAYNIIKIILIIAMVVTLSLDLNRSLIKSHGTAQVHLLFRSISITRLVLIFRLRKLYKALNIMMLSIQGSMKELALLAFIFFLCVIIYGAMMFSAEIPTDDFPTIWLGMWWAVITMTTVGYGDYHPTTSLGFVVGTLCAINGLIVLALPVAAIASNYANYYTKSADLRKHKNAVKREEDLYRDDDANGDANKEIDCIQL